jgi:hypothetical protein
MNNKMEAATWAGVIATFLAVVVALLKEEIVRLWRRPKLTATIRLEAPDCHKTELTWTNPNSGQVLGRGWCYYFRLWVENKGKQSAERVQVFTGKLMRKHADGIFREEKSFLPMNLVWSHTGEIFKERISPNMGSHCDLGYVQEPSFRIQTALAGGRTLPGVPEDKTVLALELEAKPNTLTDLLPPSVYRLELILAAANASPKVKRLEITLTGEWFPDETKMFSDGIGIVELD